MCMIGTSATVLCFCLFWSESLQVQGTLVMHCLEHGLLRRAYAYLATAVAVTTRIAANQRFVVPLQTMNGLQV